MHHPVRPPVSITHARREHAPFLARMILDASRSHLPRGPFDLALDLDDKELLAVIEHMTCSDLLSNCHFSRFLVAEAEGMPAGALAAFDPAEDDLPPLRAAIEEACSATGHGRQKLARVLAGINVLDTCFPTAAPGTWTIEWVGVDEAYRRRGICTRLLAAILTEGTHRGCRLAQISTYIGNDAAAAAYASVGFLASREHRTPELQALLGTPGLLIMRRSLP
jgi:translation initiation factor 4G